MKFLLLLLMSSVASAGQATWSWTSPTQYTDGTPITGTVTYNLRVGAKGQEQLLIGGLLSLSYQQTSLPPGEICATVTAQVDSSESDPSNEVCKTIVAPKPKKPFMKAPR